ncbi:hypothetical protein ASNO1_23350 [Corallococcus caeni]|uniref:Uncharacterized protein n=1 Tax=Corallococcus caeni TaxID=3082388 RepID=A0ABQ6QQI9_9BACT|nr:hypothetical protein ASNO1_23350 [Corallococcus sp. NO1]
MRDARTKVSRGRGLVIEHDKGSELLGMDLSQEELEWAEKVLRRALATRPQQARSKVARALHRSVTATWAGKEAPASPCL